MTKEMENSFSKLAKGAIGLGAVVAGVGTLLKGVSKLGYIEEGFDETKRIMKEFVPQKQQVEEQELPEEGVDEEES